MILYVNSIWVSVLEDLQNYWSVRRLKASPTPPCGIFNIIISGMRGLGIQIVLSCCCLVLSCCCLVRVSKGEQRRLTDSKCYIFSKSSQQLGFRWEGSKVFQGGWPCQVWKEASSLFFWRPQVFYIFGILLAIGIQVRRFYSLSRRLALPSLKRSFILISLKTPSVIYFRNPLSKCNSVRRLPSASRRLTLLSLERSFSLKSLKTPSVIYFWHPLSSCDSS